jgi:NAD(P)H-dependent flavin oxidoreductase YrpB (nitropropane dioxygenase family)
MKNLSSVLISGKEILPLVEGGKGISVTNGLSCGSWALAGGAGTFSGVNADVFDDNGQPIPIVYEGKTRGDRHKELIKHAITSGISQARIAYEKARGQGRIHMNVLWEMGGVVEVLEGILEQAHTLIHGITCGAGMPYRLAQIASHFKVFYLPIVSSARAFRVLWKRAYHKFSEWLSAVVYEDPWRAGGHNGLSNQENPLYPEDPYPRVLALRESMREVGLYNTPIIMAGGVWFLRDWQNWIDNPELGPIAFQFGTRPLLTQESPISDQWKQRLLTLNEGDIFLNRFSPTGFYSSAVNNSFIQKLREKSERQVPYTNEPVGDHTESLFYGARQRIAYVTPNDAHRVHQWKEQGYDCLLKTPASTFIAVTPEDARKIHQDQVDCMGCLSACAFSNWAQDTGSTGRHPDPRSYCIQKTLQSIAHGGSIEENLMFSGHNGHLFSTDPFYKNGFIPTVQQLIDRLITGD